MIKIVLLGFRVLRYERDVFSPWLHLDLRTTAMRAVEYETLPENLRVLTGPGHLKARPTVNA